MMFKGNQLTRLLSKNILINYILFFCNFLMSMKKVKAIFGSNIKMLKSF